MDFNEKLNRTVEEGQELVDKIEESIKMGIRPQFDEEILKYYEFFSYSLKVRYISFIPWKKLMDRTKEDFVDSFESMQSQLNDVLHIIFRNYDGKDKNVGDARLYALQKMINGEILLNGIIIRGVEKDGIKEELELLNRNRKF